jgi:hypothetical protein
MTLATDGRFQGLEDHHEPDEAGQHGAEGPTGEQLKKIIFFFTDGGTK